MFTIILDLWHHVEAMKPSFMSFKSPHFNFLTIHYFWIIGMAITASICLYPNGRLDYIDALFFGSGAATQSGLNTVDINLLSTWQQIVLYIIPVMTNPITVHSFVVFLRLYWFEKRFQHVVREAKKGRRSIARTFTKSKTQERDLGNEEMGVRGRNIVVMHDTTVPNGMTNDQATSEDFARHMEKVDAIEEEPVRSSNSSDGTKRHGSSPEGGRSKSPGAVDRASGQIKFADQVKPSENGSFLEPSNLDTDYDDDGLRRPSHRTPEEHIAILERQRKADDGAVLRIPGPRDADAGIAPQAVHDSDPVSRIVSRRASTFDSRASSDHEALNGDDHQNVDTEAQRPRNITIAEPKRSPHPTNERLANDLEAAKNTVGVLRFRKPRLLKSRTETLHEDDSTMRTVTRTRTLQAIRSVLSSKKDEDMPYLSWEPTVGRNSQFIDLTETQREELGGIEYRSLKSLAVILCAYFVGFSLLGAISLLPWILESSTYGPVVTGIGQGRAWWGIFTANSAFTDMGFTLTPDSMISFQTAIWPLLIMSFLIIIGNTGFPIMLRIIIWITSLIVPKESGIWEELKFLLDHPRRCFTLLFPSKATWWLFWVLIILNGLDLLFFIVLDFGNTIVTKLPLNIRLLDGWFQAASTRTAGFAVVNLAALHPAIQVSYLIMMYISVLPIAISVRRTNVYEEKSLGIYSSGAEMEGDTEEPSYVGVHLRRQLSFDLWYIFLGFFIISISEGSRIQSGDPAFTMFSVLFEIVSAYGTVGLSLGYTNNNASFSAQFGVIGKLVIIGMQIRGRHRGLPYELDRAILLPGEHLQKKEAADDAEARIRRDSDLNQVNSQVQRTNSRSTNKTPGGQNLFSTLLHPGPTIPNSYREPPKVRTYRERRHSIATTPMRRAMSRSVSPKAMASGARQNTMMGASLGEDVERGRTEGRRTFFKEGVNPPPPTSAQRSQNDLAL